MKALDTAGHYRLNKIANSIDYISLDDLIGLKEGTSDPSLQLVASLKKVLSVTTNAKEIHDYLVQPFIDKNLNHTKPENP